MDSKNEINNYDILFLAGLFPNGHENEIINDSKGVIQNAANALQWNIVRGLDENCDNVHILNSLYIGAFPTLYKKLFIKSYSFNHAPDKKSSDDDINTKFINFIGYKHISRFHHLKPYLKRWAIDKSENRGKEKVIIAYALTSVFTKSLKYIKRINPNIKTIMTVPDLPEYMNTTDNVSILYKIFKQRDMKKINSDLKYIDGFVVLTEQMTNVLGCKNYTVIEGIAGVQNEYSQEKNIDEKGRTILYTGTLNKKYGVMELVSAFKMLDNHEYKLVICGAGDAEEEIRAAAEKNKNIIFCGQITRGEVIKLQRNADILINPRQNNEKFTKYSFPSKNLEYLASGVPLIAFRLDGIPEEYDEYIYYADEEKNPINALAEIMNKVCGMRDIQRSEFGARAREFVINNKNPEVQARKIIDLIKRM